MNGLELLVTSYSDSESSASDDEPDDKSSHLPLPASILSWTGVPHLETVVDDPLLHDGRKRSFPHERGNWSTLVYIDYLPSEAVSSWIRSLALSLPDTGNILFPRFHVSLTRTLILKYHWIRPFLDSLRTLCRTISPFTLRFRDLAVYTNDDDSRTFLGLRCRDSTDTLDSLVRRLNNLLADYDLPPFYSDASYHVSLLWTLGDRRDSLEKLLPSLSAGFEDSLLDDRPDAALRVDAISCKVGNQLYAYRLGR